MNVVFIILDDANMMLLNHPGIHLPNISKLKQKSTTYNNNYCQAPLCGPSRASLLTGRHPNSIGILSHDQIPFRTHQPDIITLPQWFKMNGYLTAGNGKIFHPNAGDLNWYDPISWDRYDTLGPIGNPSPSTVPLNGFNSIWDWGVVEGAYIDDEVTNSAISFLQEVHSKAFFLGVGLIAAHAPWYVSQQFFNQVPPVVLPLVLDNDMDDIPQIGRDLASSTGMKHEDVKALKKWTGAFRCYLSKLFHLDYNIGRILTSLESSPYNDNTIIVLCSDHGMHVGQKYHWSKFTLWRESVQTPLIISTPGGDCKTYNMPTSNLDIFPTLLNLCGLPFAPNLEGVNLENSTCEDRTITSVYDGHIAHISDSWYQITYTDNQKELYNNRLDYSQWFNLAGKSIYLPFLQ